MCVVYNMNEWKELHENQHKYDSCCQALCISMNFNHQCGTHDLQIYEKTDSEI